MTKTTGFVFILSLSSAIAFSLPIGFRTNQNQIIYREIKTPSYFVYYDKDSPSEAHWIAKSLEAAKPILESWIGKPRTTRQPVILSSTTSHPSFANLVTDAIELQTLGQGHQTLAWHEQTHSLMYEHYHTIFGPGGSVAHLFWMPAWFIEGLAEATSSSLGSDVITGIERYHALSNHWPTFDSLHSLYQTDNSYTGYATSAGFVRWLLKHPLRNTPLPDLLRTFRTYTLPQYYPLSFNPLSSFMPMTKTLQTYTGHTDEELFEAYKLEALKHYQAEKNRTHAVTLQNSNLPLKVFKTPIITSDPKTNQLVMFESSKQKNHKSRHRNTSYNARQDMWTGFWHYDLTHPTASLGLIPLENHFIPKKVIHTTDHIWVIGQQKQTTKLCFYPKFHNTLSFTPDQNNKPICPLSFDTPHHLDYLFTSTASSLKQDQPSLQSIYLALTTQTLTGDQSKLLSFDLKTMTSTEVPLRFKGLIQSLVQIDETLFILSQERDARVLRKVSKNGDCLARANLTDHILNLYSTPSKMILQLFTAKGSVFQDISLSQQNLWLDCKLDKGSYPDTPLMAALRAQTPTDAKTPAHFKSLQDFIIDLDPWTFHKPLNPLYASSESNFDGQPATSQNSHKASETLSSFSDKERTWRARPLLWFPWIASQSPVGDQIGMITLPLMDHLQNETIRATFLWGLDSRYPSAQIMATTTRFSPTYHLSFFRQTRWDGYTDSLPSTKRGSRLSRYYDEQGFDLSMEKDIFLHSDRLHQSLSLKVATYRPYINIDDKPLQLTTLSYMYRYDRTFLDGQLSLAGALQNALPFLNKDFSYFRFMQSSSYSYPFFINSLLKLKAELKKTIGSKTFQIKEYYQPIGSNRHSNSGDLNQFHLSLWGDQSLFHLHFGDSALRTSLDWKIPVYEHLNRRIWALFAESVSMTASTAVGAAYDQGGPIQLIKSQAYSLDVILENKGVRLTTSIGIGQVIDQPIGLFGKFGFDALF